VTGEWWRWSSYTILDGVIVPEEGATLEAYDPWKVYFQNVGRYRTVEQPYVSLLELNRLRPPPFRPLVHPSLTPSRLMLNWCSQYGHLGILPTLANSIRVPAGRRGRTKGGEESVAIVHHRAGGEWLSYEPYGGRSKPGVNQFDYISGAYDERPITEILPFFPGLRPEQLPCPNSPEFWKYYGEPVEALDEWCQMFTNAVNGMSRFREGLPAPSPKDVELASFRMLSALAQSAAPTFTLDLDRGTLSEHRFSAGLLASFALMFLWDWREGRRALQCHNCQRFFVSDELRAMYCSPRCRNTAQSRRYRSKKESK
jgi:hypothetical protein